jgi:LysM repeat protein
MPRRWLFYLALNALVSATVTLTVLFLWQRAEAPPKEVPTPKGLAPASSPLPTLERITPTPKMYAIQSGDTLSTIANEYGVTVDALLAANQLGDPNRLEVGQVILIPPSGPTETPAPRASITPQLGEPYPWPRVAQIRAAGDLLEEAVEVDNPGPGFDLTGWRLHSMTGADFVFPAFSLQTGGAVWVHTEKGTDTSTDLYWGSSKSVWQTGEEILLLDNLGRVRYSGWVP